MNRDKTILLVIGREPSVLAEMTANLEKETFLTSEKEQRAVIMTLLNIGEKVKQLSDDFRQKHSDVPWKHISGLRDMVAHSCFKLDMEDIWNTLYISIPEFLSRSVI
ncbi:MAG: DUF86 domain-containing protein [Candidatus Cloacimonas sp.]|jgi:uncharacterized protein with HEPN domain|nr:DUF86 domain-containing protein [Candidatus Cloacimonas sp.]